MSTDLDFERQAEGLLARIPEAPTVGVILGSGLGGFASQLSSPLRIPVSEIAGYPHSTVAGHAGALYFGHISEGPHRSQPLLIFQGRVHFYESGDLSTAVAPIRLARALGIRSILITNAAGGIDRTFSPGDLMLIEDVITLNRSISGFEHHPATGRSAPLMDRSLCDLIIEAARETKVELRQGTYAWVHGPSYETAAEIRMLATIGAHAVGMSTVPEIVEARRYGLRTAGISLISNMGTGISDTRLTHEEVTATARRASERFTSLVRHALLHFPG
jgi:purine-nucleoside phosphorylase